MRNTPDVRMPAGESEETPVVLTRIVPRPGIRAVFWALRVYIGFMVALVIIGFLRGMH